VRDGAFEGSFVPGEEQVDLEKYVNIQVKQTSGVKKYLLLKSTAKCHMA